MLAVDEANARKAVLFAGILLIGLRRLSWALAGAPGVARGRTVRRSGRAGLHGGGSALWVRRAAGVPGRSFDRTPLLKPDRSTPRQHHDSRSAPVPPRTPPLPPPGRRRPPLL